MKKWRCTVCGYIHDGPEPPEECPVCHAPREAFAEVTDEEAGRSAPPEGKAGVDAAAGDSNRPGGPSASPIAPLVREGMDFRSALFDISYGMFVVTSRKGDRFNGQTCNTVFQVTSQPPRVAVAINKQNLTHEFISESRVMAISILGKGNMGAIKRFGLSSGRTQDKFAGLDVKVSPVVGCPVLPDSVSFLECRVVPELSVDVGTHTLFVADVVGGGRLRGQEPITYGTYRANRGKPEVFADDVDWNNVVSSLNLEFGAFQRYMRQGHELRDPELVSILEGVMRTEGDHVDNALKYLQSRLEEKVPGLPPGLAKEFLYVMLDLDFEETARSLYLQFAQETSDPDLKRMFTEQAQSEQGHVNIFRSLLEAFKDGSHRASFFCPVCGWRIKPEEEREGEELACPKCGARFTLRLADGNWSLSKGG